MKTMKKIITVILSAILTLSCGLFLGVSCEKLRVENEYGFFSEEALKRRGISDIPQFSCGKHTRTTSRDFAANTTYEEYEAYVEAVYNYFLEKDVKYCGVSENNKKEIYPIEDYKETFGIKEKSNRWYVEFVWANKKGLERQGEYFENRLVSPEWIRITLFKENQTGMQLYEDFSYNLLITLKHPNELIYLGNYQWKGEEI